jgi:hypothetical protein
MIHLKFFDVDVDGTEEDPPFAEQIVSYVPHVNSVLNMRKDGIDEAYVVGSTLWEFDCDKKIHSAIHIPTQLVSVFVRRVNEKTYT